ncbi:MAG: ribosome silencing factor [Clostridia bacterium]|jgi:ribosome-associated protein|nr:ribosome silencing factor [Clostridia bacterium]MBQ4245497.1 ribosome silencing factor [Clostridia bacterium]
MESTQLALEIIKVLDKKKAVDIREIRTEEVTIVSDYFVIASGTSNTHTKSLAEEVEFELKKLGIEPDHIEGRATGWILLDYGTVIVHIFTEDQREYYNLERLWADANFIDLSDVLTQD